MSKLVYNRVVLVKRLLAELKILINKNLKEREVLRKLQEIRDRQQELLDELENNLDAKRLNKAINLINSFESDLEECYEEQVEIKNKINLIFIWGAILTVLFLVRIFS